MPPRRRCSFTSRQTVFKPHTPPNKHRLTVDEMLTAAHLLGEGESIRRVFDSVGGSPATIHRIKQRCTGKAVIVREPDHDKAFLAHFVTFCLLENPHATGKSIYTEASTIGFKTSTSTVNKVAYEMNFRSIMTHKQEKLSEQQKAYRVQFCQKIRLWFGYTLPWIFTDETMLLLNPLKKKVRVIRGVDVPEKYMEVVGYPTKVMVWAAVGDRFKSPLVRVTGNLNAIGYQKLLTDCKIFEMLDDRYGKFGYVLQQDGARPHTARTTLDFLASRARTLPPECHWPACSPDLNVIENLWAIFKKCINFGAIHDADSMFEEAVRAWNNIPIETVDKLTADFEPRLDACIAVAGQCLNMHQQVLRGFRVSAEAGQEAVAASLTQKACLEAFKMRSRAFFANDFKSVVRWSRLSSDPEVRKAQIALNKNLWTLSAHICLILPETIRKKCQLPLQPVDI